MTAHVDLDRFFHVRSWLAVQTDDAAEVARLLGAVDAKTCTFAAGAEALSRRDVDATFFVCEPVDGWTLVFGEAIGLEMPPAVRSRKFSQVHAFHLDDSRGIFRCTRTIDGSTVREISAIEGEYSAEGTPDPGEPELPAQEGSVEPADAAGDQRKGLTHEKVLRIAEAWGADPTQIVGRVQAGYLCRTTGAVQAAVEDRRGSRSAAVRIGLVVAALGLLAAMIFR